MKTVLLVLITSLCFPGLVLAVSQIDINTATLAQLDRLTGVGPAIAQRIIDARPYASLDELVKVRGIGPKILQKIKDQGLAYVVATSSILPKPEKSDTTGNVAVAATKEVVTPILSQKLVARGATNPWLLFFSVLAAAIVMAGILLFLKLKVFQNHVRP